ncbi:rRNA maturation RNase YbeY [Aestuariibius insulae]|uniref:rRNA maturation RNase YbeY n=1 Tax=Aestuariibius insulae TaxID=2058287 RepID=UPI00345E5A6F
MKPVDVVIEDPRWESIDIEKLADQAASATLERLGLEPSICEIACLVCDDARIAVLNADFRQKSQPTNVLSWPSEDRAAMAAGEMPQPPAPDPGGLVELGDIALAYETCLSESVDFGISLTDHTTHLIVHGTLHLLGFDHIREADACLMEDLEAEILGNLGLKNPYDRT